MQWTMPHRALQIVAGLIGLAAAASFAVGVVNAPQRGRLPGEKAGGGVGAAAPIDAADATPLSNERIEGPPQPTPEEIAAKKAEADAKAKAEAAAAQQDPDAADKADTTAVSPAPPRVTPPPAGNSAAPEAPVTPTDEPPH